MTARWRGGRPCGRRQWASSDRHHRRRPSAASAQIAVRDHDTACGSGSDAFVSDIIPAGLSQLGQPQWTTTPLQGADVARYAPPAEEDYNQTYSLPPRQPSLSSSPSLTAHARSSSTSSQTRLRPVPSWTIRSSGGHAIGTATGHLARWAWSGCQGVRPLSSGSEHNSALARRGAVRRAIVSHAGRYSHLSRHHRRDRTANGRCGG